MRWNDRTLVRVAKSLGALGAAMGLIGLVWLPLQGRSDILFGDFVIENSALAMGFGIVVWLITPRQPRNWAVWALGGSAFFTGLYSLADASLIYMAESRGLLITLETVRAQSPSTTPTDIALVGSITTWTWAPGTFLPLTFGLLLFPDGRLPSPRWRWVAWLTGAAVIVVTAGAFSAFLPNSTNLYQTDDYFAYEGFAKTLGVTVPLLLVLALVCTASLFVRYRHSVTPERQQIRWIGLAGVALVLSLLVGYTLAGGPQAGAWDLVILMGIVVFPTAYGVAILKYRLYDIDVVISKTVTYLGLAGAITLLYAAVVVGPTLVLGGSEDGGPGLVLPIVATAIVAMLFEPIRARLQLWANRLVYGDRATPYSALSQMSSRMASSEPDVDELAQLAEISADGTGASSVAVWVRVGNRLQPAAQWPDSDELLGSAAETSEIDRALVVPVVDGEEVIGAIGLDKHRGDPVNDVDRSLVSDLAGAATLLLRNRRLNAELADRAAQLRASRRRLVAAHDAERHRLERDLHDGAQQQVVALKVKLGLAKAIADKEGAADLAGLLDGLVDHSQEVVDSMRAVARGIYPPLLQAEGLGPALAAAERSAPIPLEIEAVRIGRYDQHVEEAAYFCVVETVERAVLAGARGIHAEVRTANGDLLVQIDHDGRIADADYASVADRIDAVGGSTTVEPRSGSMTRVVGRIPAGGGLR